MEFKYDRDRYYTSRRSQRMNEGVNRRRNGHRTYVSLVSWVGIICGILFTDYESVDFGRHSIFEMYSLKYLHFGNLKPLKEC